MNIVECHLLDKKLIHTKDELAFNPEQEIALIKGTNKFDFAFSVGCNRIYNKVQKWKMIYPVGNYSEAWEYIQTKRGIIESIDDKFEAVMKDEGLELALGNVRLNRINFEVKTQTNGKSCEPCEC